MGNNIFIGDIIFTIKKVLTKKGMGMLDFTMATPVEWNKPPLIVRSHQAGSRFRSHLKTVQIVIPNSLAGKLLGNDIFLVLNSPFLNSSTPEDFYQFSLHINVSYIITSAKEILFGCCLLVALCKYYSLDIPEKKIIS